MNRREYLRNYMRRYNATDKGKAANRQNVRNWRKRNKVTKRSPTRKTSAKLYRAILIDALVKRDGFECGLCGESLEGLAIHLDHIIPSALGGPDTLENMQLAHAQCNMDQGPSIRKLKHGY